MLCAQVVGFAAVLRQVVELPGLVVAVAGRANAGGRATCSKTQWIERVARSSGLSAEQVAVLLDRCGTAAEAYAASPDADTPLESLPDYTVGEISRIATHDSIVHLTDLVCRRSTIALLGQATRAVLEELAGIVGPALDWDSVQQADEVRRTLAEVAVPTSP